MSAQDMAQSVEELQPLARGEVQAPRSGRRGKVAVAVGLGLGLAAAAAYTLAPGSKQSRLTAVDGLQSKVADGLSVDDMARQEAMDSNVQVDDVDLDNLNYDFAWGVEPLTLESDMGKFIKEGALPTEALTHGFGASAGQVAEKLFDTVAHESDVKKELTEQELSAYKYRFIAAMVDMADSNKGPTEDFVARAKRHIEATKPVMSESLAAVINNRQKSFKVKIQDWMLDESRDSFESRLIKVPYTPPFDATKVFLNELPDYGLKSGDLPRNFESSENWPECAQVIVNPHNQGRCGSCWVFGATGALDSRLCIATKGTFSGPNAALSRGVGASCAAKDADGAWDGCQGGWPHLVYDYIQAAGGLPSTSCIPYFGGTDYASHWTDAMGAPPCPAACDPRMPRPMEQDRFDPVGIAQYKLVDKPNEQGIKDMKQAIFNEGTVPYAFYANNAFMGYHSGVFDQACGHQANHAVQAIGFGTENGKDYINSLNSWGTDWGNQGKFKVSHCVVWHYVIPGTFTSDAHGEGFPLPIPAWKQ